MFHADIGRFLGLDIKAGILERAHGIGGPEDCWLHEVSLYIPGGAVKTTVAFKEGLACGGLLGMAGFFEHFKITFDSVQQECLLERIYHA